MRLQRGVPNSMITPCPDLQDGPVAFRHPTLVANVLPSWLPHPLFSLRLHKIADREISL
ncbi:hypothetical protein BDN72DRAFT_65077 [Pluteus cervinus]|uniref:Uncharacterized protein n=1 Tax=Pluteus cervinus TaxID=181527 RepID=A0ACD2ZYT3_9AGAR|nr:hypothetical protein BDN72DRAFT_65077 [Pluteus cervinus]